MCGETLLGGFWKLQPCKESWEEGGTGRAPHLCLQRRLKVVHLHLFASFWGGCLWNLFSLCDVDLEGSREVVEELEWEGGGREEKGHVWLSK